MGLASDEMRPEYGHLREDNGRWKSVAVKEGRGLLLIGVPLDPELLLHNPDYLGPALTWRGRLLRAAARILRFRL